MAAREPYPRSIIALSIDCESSIRYLSEPLKDARLPVIREIVEHYPLATLCVQTPAGMVANHLPFLADEEEGVWTVAKSKLSQNRNSEDYVSVAEKMEGFGKHFTAKQMRQAPSGS